MAATSYRTHVPISSSLFCSVHRSALLGQINEDGDIWNMCRRRKVDLFLIALPSWSGTLFLFGAARKNGVVVAILGQNLPRTRVLSRPLQILMTHTSVRIACRVPCFLSQLRFWLLTVFICQSTELVLPTKRPYSGLVYGYGKIWNNSSTKTNECVPFWLG